MTLTNRKDKENTDITLPSGWHYSKLKDVINEAQTGFACGTRSSVGIIQLRMNNVDTRGNFVWDEYLRVPAEVTDLDKYRLEAGDIVFNNTNSTELVGKSALFQSYPESVVYSNHFTRIRVNSEYVFPTYVVAWLNWQYHRGIFADICNRWIGQSAVKNEILFDLNIPLPTTIDEQKRISRILIAQMAAIEKARTAAKARLEAAKALPAAYLREIFESEESRKWQKVRLGDILRVKSGNFLPANNMNTLGKYPVYGGNGINGYHDNFMFDEPKIIIGRVGAQCGCICVSEPNSWITDNALYVSDKLKPFDDAFMALLLKKLDLNSKANSMAQPLVSGKIIYDIETSLPDVDEQKQIADSVHKIYGEIEALFVGIQEELETINILPVTILEQAFSGGL